VLNPVPIYYLTVNPAQGMYTFPDSFPGGNRVTTPYTFSQIFLLTSRTTLSSPMWSCHLGFSNQFAHKSPPPQARDLAACMPSPYRWPVCLYRCGVMLLQRACSSWYTEGDILKNIQKFVRRADSNGYTRCQLMADLKVRKRFALPGRNLCRSH
jgi:hypothetical protein